LNPAKCWIKHEDPPNVLTGSDLSYISQIIGYLEY